MNYLLWNLCTLRRISIEGTSTLEKFSNAHYYPSKLEAAQKIVNIAVRFVVRLIDFIFSVSWVKICCLEVFKIPDTSKGNTNDEIH